MKDLQDKGRGNFSPKEVIDERANEILLCNHPGKCTI